MPRLARLDIAGLLQHVIVRGIEQRDIFNDDYDRQLFLDRFTRASTLTRLRTLQQATPLVGDVRGMGLMIGVEPVEPDGKPAAAACGRVLEQSLQQGLIVINCGPERNVVRLIPPLTIRDDELQQALDILEKAIITASSD